MAFVDPAIFSHLRTTVTCAEAAVIFQKKISTIQRWCRLGHFDSVMAGNTRLISMASILRLKKLGTPVIKAQLRHREDDRGRAGQDLETDAEDAAKRAKALAAIAKAKLAKAQREDLEALDTELPVAAPSEISLDQLPALNRLRVSLMLGAYGLKPASGMSDLELLQLARRLNQALGGTCEKPVPEAEHSASVPDNWPACESLLDSTPVTKHSPVSPTPPLTISPKHKPDVLPPPPPPPPTMDMEMTTPPLPPDEAASRLEEPVKLESYEDFQRRCHVERMQLLRDALRNAPESTKARYAGWNLAS